MNKKNVLYIVEDEKSAQFRYRVYNLMRLFDDDNEWNIKYKLTGEHIDENLILRITKRKKYFLIWMI